ncbi:MAG: YbaY family lipoprotein [Nitrosospira sp.]|nr:YbaY family lipoprotein [Nitrosospira sp.]
MNTVPLVKGKVTFEEVAPPFTGATMYVRLENITFADAASKVVAEYVKRDVAFDPKISSDLTFAITGNLPDPSASYAVRVHIDVDGDGEVSQGDFVSMQSYPVITFGHPSEVSILARQVK